MAGAHDHDTAHGDLGLSPSVLPPPLPSLALPPAPPRRPPPDPDRRRTFTRSVPFPQERMDAPSLARLHRWVECFAIVEFDLDLGPDLDNVYPYTKYSDALKANIAFSSLPEGDMPTAAGAHTFSWRIPLPPSEKGKATNEEEEIFGFVYFVQEKNTNLRRGYTQRSLVLITHLPEFVGLFSALVGTLGPLHFKHHESEGGMIETACRNIASWPDPTPGTTLELPFLGTVQTVEIPLVGQSQWASPPSPSLSRQTPVGGPSVIPASLPLTPLSTFFPGTPPVLSFSRLLLLWELVLLGEPIVVYSSDPRTGSELVWHLRGLIRPIIPAGDFRPYFHIHDTDFSRLANPTRPQAGTILAITNPLLLSTFKAWPHILRATTSKTDSSGAAPGLMSTRKRHVKKDAGVAREVEKLCASGDYLGCDALVLKHLRTLTERFLAPLNRYFGTLPSLDTSLLTPRSSRSFQPSTFLSSLKTHGTPLPLRSSPSLTSPSSTPVERFYTRFLHSPNFASWLHGRMDVAEGEVRKAYLRRLAEVDLQDWMGGRADGEVEELVGRLEREAVIFEAPSSHTELNPSTSPDRTRGIQLRQQVARLKTLQIERLANGSGVESDSDAGSFVGAAGR